MKNDIYSNRFDNMLLHTGNLPTGKTVDVDATDDVIQTWLDTRTLKIAGNAPDTTGMDEYEEHDAELAYEDTFRGAEYAAWHQLIDEWSDSLIVFCPAVEEDE